jgi:MFS family permease
MSQAALQKPVAPAGGPAGEWRSSWNLVVAGAVGMMIVSVPLYSMGIFIAPLQQEFGWSRFQITAANTIVSTLGLAAGPLVGALVDRVGARRVGLPGAMLFCTAFGLLSVSSGSIWSWWSLWTLMAVATLGVSPVIWTFMVARAFDRSRGLALALTLGGTGLGLAAAPNLGRVLIDRYGWRGAYVGLALCMAVVIIPSTLALMKPRAGRSPPAGRSVSPAAAAQAYGLAWRQALFSARFVKLAVAALTFSICAVSFTVNLVPILTSTGIGRASAAAAAGVIGLASIIGRISTGFLLDRFNGNVVGAAAVTAPIIGCLCLVLTPGLLGVAVFSVFLIGLALGGEYDVMAYLAAKHFGTRSFGVLFASINAMIAIAAGIGPALISLVFDVSGSYAPALWASVPLYLLGAASLLSLGPFPDFAAEAGQVREPEASALAQAVEP